MFDGMSCEADRMVLNRRLDMRRIPCNEDLRIFLQVARKGSFAKAAEEENISTAHASKRVRVLEELLGIRLLHRTTRRVKLTESGERLLCLAQRVLEEAEQLMRQAWEMPGEPRGPLSISCSSGFGKDVIAPAISALATRYPELNIRFEMLDRAVDIIEEGFDLDIRMGDDIATHLIAKRLGSNRRILCASPAYLKRHGIPDSLSDLARHNCLLIKERDQQFGAWRLQGEGLEQTVKVTGTLSSNQGEIVTQWALDSHGIMLRSLWDVHKWLARGDLSWILPQYTQRTNIWAVYSERMRTSTRNHACVHYLHQYFQDWEQRRDVPGNAP